MKKRMLITGGCGFIGKNAALHFADKGYDIYVVDNLSRPGSEINAETLKARGPENGIRMVKILDVVESGEELKKLMADEAIDVVIHAAAQVAVTTSVTDPLLDFRTNALGTLNVLEAARASSRKPLVIFTSTNKVYGQMEEVETTEGGTRHAYKDLAHGIHEHVPLDFHSPYGCSKGSADQYVRDYYRIYGLPTVVFRQSCIYGEHQFGIVDQGWVSYLTMKALFNMPITVYGDGKQVRDVLFMSDLNRAFEAAIENVAAAQGEIFNVGGGPSNTLSLLEFLSHMEKRLNKKLDVRFSDWRPGDQKVYISDIRKAGATLGWKPQVPFNEGFEKMFAWIEKHRGTLEKLVH